MEMLDYVRSGALAIGLLACMLAGKDAWLLADTIVWAGLGASLYFFPKHMLEYQCDGTLDKFHIYFAQAIGAVYLAHGAMSFYSRRSRNTALHANQFVARALTGVIILQCTVFDYFKAAGDKQRLNTNVFTFGMLGCVILTVGNLYYAFKSSVYGGGVANLRNRVSIHIFIDIILMVTLGLAYYSFPEVVLSPAENLKPDGIHAHLVRLFGCLNFMAILLALNSLSFPADEDKRLYLFCRLVAIGLVLPLFILYQWKYSLLSVSSYRMVWIGTILVTGNIVLGYLPPISLSKLKRN